MRVACSHLRLWVATTEHIEKSNYGMTTQQINSCALPVGVLLLSVRFTANTLKSNKTRLVRHNSAARALPVTT